MERQFLNPNWHVILIHYPLGLLTIGLLVELFSFLWPRHSFRYAGHWMVLLATLLAVPATFSGIYALWDVANPSHDELTWKEIGSAGHLSAGQWKFLIFHLRMMSIATGLSLVAVVTWLGSSDDLRRKLHVPLTIVLSGAVGLMIAGSWYGGETVYTQATAVGLPAPATMEGATVFQQKLEYYGSPIQAHVVMAGLTMGLALVTLGLSFRKLSNSWHVPQMDHIAAALEPGDSTVVDRPPHHWIPASRFWLLASLLGILTAGGGYYLIAQAFGTWDAKTLWTHVSDKGHPRLFAHLIAGGMLILIPLILASLARWGHQQRVLLTIFSLLLLAAVGSQIWFGILLLLDGGQGLITKMQ